MATFVVDYETEQGPRRRHFSVDADRPLGPQVRRILEELRAQGEVLRGGHQDRLEVRWGGVVVDAALSPQQLALDPARPIELRMKRTEPDAVRLRIALTAGEPRRAFVPIEAKQLLLRGAALTSIAWTLLLPFDSVVPLGGDVEALDALGILALSVALCLSSASWLRTRKANSLLVIVLHLAAGLTAGLLISIAAWRLLESGVSSGLTRAFVLATVGLVPSALARARAGIVGPFVLLASTVLASMMGLLAWVLTLAPGASDLWQGISWMLVGAGTGFAAGVTPALFGAGVLEEQLGRRSLRDFLALSTYPIRKGVSTDVPTLSGSTAATLAALDADGYEVVSVEETVTPVDGRSMGQIRVTNGDLFWIGDALFRLRLSPK